MAMVKASAGYAKDIDVINAPGLEAGDMPGPGSNVVLVVRRPGSVDVFVEAVSGSSSLDAKFSLDLLAPAQVRPQGNHSALEPMPRVSADPMPMTRRGRSLVTVKLFAHVARRGDIVADPAGWLAGPQSPSAIEGIEFRCDGADVGIAAQYRNTLDRNQWSTWQSPGTFMGTRQRASPLTGLRLKLVGAVANRFEIETEALFLGSPVAVQRGSELELTSLGGMDVLVGLKLTLIERPIPQTEIHDRKISRVRVFRSSAG